MNRQVKILNQIMTACFYILFAITPLVFTSLNYELFEFNKMVVVYFLTTFIIGSWIIKMILSKSFFIRRTPLDLPILLFLISQILSTIFSIDVHTSIWGYYSRSNGGLLSTLCYIFLYYALVSNYSSITPVKRFLKAALAGGLVVSVWAILEHFGHSVSCLILTGSFNDACWVQDVQSRVFATLGQPNWLAAYMAMLIFPTIYFLLTTKSRKIAYGLIVSILLFYGAFTFTYSRGALVGFLAGLATFIIGLVIVSKRDKINPPNARQLFSIVLLLFLLLNLFYGSAISRFRLFTQSVPPPQPSQAAVSQIETGGTESGQIRKIVWLGALEIFKHFPLLGSGVETFAYSYYQFRPAEHNLTSEWDFLYNKAHNEYLNYLATTGIIGFLTYMSMIVVFMAWCIKQTLSLSKDYFETKVLLIALLSAYISYLVQNSVQFSVVIIAVFFYVFPALAMIPIEENNLILFPLGELNSLYKAREWLYRAFHSLIYRRRLYSRIAVVVLVLLVVYLSLNIALYWLADTHYASGTHFLEAGYASSAFNQFTDAEVENSREPLYKSNLGFDASYIAVDQADKDATLSAQLKNVAVVETQKTLDISPNNVTFWRTAYRTYYQLSSLDQSYTQKTLDTLDKTISLSPTDPKTYLDKANILDSLQKEDQAINTINQAIALKPDYKEAYFALESFYKKQGKKDIALEQMNKVLKFIPNDPDALNEIKQLQASK